MSVLRPSVTDACRAILRWDARGSRAGHLHGNALSKRSVIITVNKSVEAAIATIKGEMQQTTLPVDEKKTEVKTGSKEAKDAAKKVNEAKK